MDEITGRVKAYYDENAQKEWERLERHPFELPLTLSVMEQHIRPGDSVLDLGGGPGRYAIHFAEMGCRVTLIDLSDGNIALAREKAAEAGVALDARVCDCLALDALALPQYDHVLLMGPLYHLHGTETRRRAIAQALRRLKPGGLFYCTFILDVAGLAYDLKNAPGLLAGDLGSPETAALLDSIAGGTQYEGPAFTSVCFLNQRQIEPLLAPFGLEKLHLFGQEGILAPFENQWALCPPEERALWLKTAERLLELPELLSYSEHAMYIGRKPESPTI